MRANIARGIALCTCVIETLLPHPGPPARNRFQWHSVATSRTKCELLSVECRPATHSTVIQIYRDRPDERRSNGPDYSRYKKRRSRNDRPPPPPPPLYFRTCRSSFPADRLALVSARYTLGGLLAPASSHAMAQPTLLCVPLWRTRAKKSHVNERKPTLICSLHGGHNQHSEPRKSPTRGRTNHFSSISPMTLNSDL